MGTGDDFRQGGGVETRISKREDYHSVGLLFLPNVSRCAVVLGHRINFVFNLLHESRYKLCVRPVGAVPDPEVFTTPSGTGSLSTPM